MFMDGLGAGKMQKCVKHARWGWGAVTSQHSLGTCGGGKEGQAHPTLWTFTFTAFRRHLYSEPPTEAAYRDILVQQEMETHKSMDVLNNC